MLTYNPTTRTLKMSKQDKTKIEQQKAEQLARNLSKNGKVTKKVKQLIKK